MVRRNKSAPANLTASGFCETSRQHWCGDTDAARLPPRTPDAGRTGKTSMLDSRFSMRYWRLLALVAALLFAPLAGAQADYGREKRWADEVVPAIVVGDAVYVAQKSGHKFLTIWTPNAQATAGVIVVHGLGVHPDWGLINPLRSQLADQGYATLSVQMPVLMAEMRANYYPPLFPEAAERIAAAVDFLREKGLKRIAIVSHGLGSTMVNYYLNQAADARVDAWVSIGLPAGEYAVPETLKAPVLDLYGERDLPVILENAGKRAAAIRGIRGSAQVQVAGADHFFAGMEGELVRRVRQFLDARLKM